MRKAAPEGVVFSLIALFKASSEFTGLGDKTKRNYLRYVKLIEKKFGDLPLAALEEKET